MYGFEAMTFNIHGGYLEAIVGGHRAGLLTAADYNNLCQCETLDDIKLHLSATEYGPYIQNGSQKALQLAALCLGRDPKVRPLMSEVVEVLTLLPKMKDMASSSSWYFQALQAERAAAAANARTGSRSSARFSRNAQPNRSLSTSNGPNGLPYQLKHRQWSPRDQPNRSLFASNGPNGSPYQVNHRQWSPHDQPNRRLCIEWS